MTDFIDIDLLDEVDQETDSTIDHDFYLEDVSLSENAWWDKFVRRPLTKEESAELKVPKADLSCSVMHFSDKKGKSLGFRAYTHRAATKLYSKVSDIPRKQLEFISSTS